MTDNAAPKSKVPEFVWHIPFYIGLAAVVYVVFWRWIPCAIEMCE